MIQRAFLSLLLAGVLATAQAPPAAAFLERLQCEMDPLYDWCLTRRLQKLAETMPQGKDRDIAVMHAYAGWWFASRSDDEKAVRSPRASYFSDLIDDRQIRAIVGAIDQTLFRDAPSKGVEWFTRVKHPVPRMLGYPVFVRSLIDAGATTDAVRALTEWRAEAAALPAPPPKIAAFAEIAWLAARLGEANLARDAMAAFEAAASQHPLADYRTVLGADLGPAEAELGDTDAAILRLQAGSDALGAIAGMPEPVRAQAYARIARGYGRVGQEDRAREVARTALNLMSELDGKAQVRVLSILVFAQIGF